MKTIWKFKLATIDHQSIFIPEGFEMLTIDIQNGDPCLWARVDPNAEKKERVIAIHGTGHPLPESTGDYIGTYQMSGGALIFHVFKSNKAIN